MAGAWFTPRPDAVYWARWTGDDLAELEADPQLPGYLTLTVQEDGSLRVTSVVGTSLTVPVGGWFSARQVWTDEGLRARFQELGDQLVGPYSYQVIGTDGGGGASGV